MSSAAQASSTAFLLSGAVFLAMSGALRADTVTLRDGTEYEGEILRQTAEALIFRVRWGGLKGSVRIPKSEIVALQAKPLPPDTVIAGAETLRKEAEQTSRIPSPEPQIPTPKTQPPARDSAGGDTAIRHAPSGTSNPRSETPGSPAGICNRPAADAWVRLGEYYQRHHGYSAQAREAFQNALLADSGHPVAREKLGYIKVGDQWIEKPKPKPAAPEDDVTIGLRKDEQQASARTEIREVRPEVPAAVVPLIPANNVGGWGGSELIVTTWPWYGGWDYQPWYGSYPGFYSGWHGHHNWRGYPWSGRSWPVHWGGGWGGWGSGGGWGGWGGRNGGVWGHW